MARIRAFVALELPGELRALAAGVAAQLRRDFPVLRPVRDDLIHLTLRFLGEVETAALPALEGGLRRELAATRGVRLRLCGLGVFPDPRRARVLWAGVQADPALESLASAVTRACARLAAPHSRDEPFRAHVTIGRFRAPAGPGLAEALARRAREPIGTEIVLREAIVFRSQLGAGGAEHTALLRLGLGERAA